MRPYCISTLTRWPGGSSVPLTYRSISSVPLTYRSIRPAGPPATSSCQTSELRFSRGVQTEALDASCGPRPPPLPAFKDAAHGRRTSSPDYQYCLLYRVCASARIRVRPSLERVGGKHRAPNGGGGGYGDRGLRRRSGRLHPLRRWRRPLSRGGRWRRGRCGRPPPRRRRISLPRPAARSLLW
jgi:hypothetical protein